MNKGKILITGGTGYIGSHTVVSLIEAGYQVILLDNLMNSELSTLDGIERITGVKPAFKKLDLCDLEQVKTFFSVEKNITGIIHFAALKAVGESVAKPLLYYRNNLDSMLAILEGMQSHNIKNLIFSSSATVYGEPENLPINEESPRNPALSPYGNTKIICEDIIRDFCKANPSINAIALRYFNPVGAHDSGEIGELPSGTPNNLMPFITQTGIGLRKELKVFGKDYNTSDGTAVRDYIHIMDLADAHLKAMNRLIEGKQTKNYEIFNLGTGQGHSVLEVIQSFEKVSGMDLPYQFVERRAGDVECLYTSTETANQALDWEAKKVLDDMTASAWKWEQKIRAKLSEN